MRSLDQLIDRHGVDVFEHLDRQVAVPVVAGLQAQGDVIVVPQVGAAPATTHVPPAGFPVVRGESGGNTHLLLGDGTVYFDPDERAREITLGILTVPDGAVAYLAHPEHGYAGVAPGTYQLRRQREQAEQIRMVAD